MANKKCLNCGEEQYITIDAEYYVASLFSYIFYCQFIFSLILGRNDRVLNAIGLSVIIAIGFKYLSIEHKPKRVWVNNNRRLNLKKFFHIFVWVNVALISLGYIYKFLNY